MYTLLSRTHHIIRIAVLLVAVCLSMLAGGAVVHAMTSHSPVVVDNEASASAVPSKQQKPIGKGSVERPYIGVTYQPITPQLVQLHGLKTTQGDLVSYVANSSPATKAGLQTGDVIVAVDGHKVDDEHPLTAALIDHAPGDVIRLQVERGWKVSTLTVTLGVRPSAGSH